MGRILKVDLSEDQISIEEPWEGFYRRYFGGRALVAYYLLKELQPGTDPFGPENILVFSTGVATGAPISGSGRNSVGEVAVDTCLRRRRGGRLLGCGAEEVWPLWTLWRHFMNCAVLCIFPPWSYSQVAEIVSAATGWETSVWELLKVGERAANLTRAFNVREGFTSKDDDLPERFFSALTEGPLAGVVFGRRDFLEARRLYYQMMNWDEETGIPTPAKLHELDLGWVADELGRHGKV